MIIICNTIRVSAFTVRDDIRFLLVIATRRRRQPSNVASSERHRRRQQENVADVAPSRPKRAVAERDEEGERSAEKDRFAGRVEHLKVLENVIPAQNGFQVITITSLETFIVLII
jgi:hypothetical protein